MFTKLTEQLKANPRTIVFTEGTDPRIQEAADKLTNAGILNVILLGEKNEVEKAARKVDLKLISARFSIRRLMKRWNQWLRRWLNSVKAK